MKRFKTFRRTIRRPFETATYLLFQWTCPFLPRKIVVLMARFLGKMAMLIPSRERKIGLENLDRVFGDTKSDAEKRQILKQSFSTFALTMLDVFWFMWHAEKRIPKYIKFPKEAHVLYEDKPLVLITAHFGNWELIGQAAALHKSQFISIAATLKNKQVDRMLCNLRKKTGQIIIPQKGAMRTLIAHLRKGGKIAFVLDQHTGADEGGIPIDFLGKSMSVSSAPAAFAYRTGTKIILGFSIPQPGGKYKVISLPPIIPPPYNKENDTAQIAKELTQTIQNEISSFIRTHPEFWLWAYRHWR